MAWAMQDESVKVQMFRFIDVLPMLTTPESIARHLHEYFDDVRDRLPSAARFGLAVATPTSLGRRGLAAIARRNAMTHARRFIAGTDRQRSAGRGPARAAAEAGLHARHPGRSRDQRGGSRPVAAGII